ncbi:unnamed protein product [Litomosoides sigmodontis]|uniref:CCN TSP1 domain-containing protein n=1 Tax=Litomosoides sigmodontis TaxID=42156 RepID=A0A3P6UP85_LITSI|nr:unnamed protein product [Litomosoides sigmodontis]
MLLIYLFIFLFPQAHEAIIQKDESNPSTSESLIDLSNENWNQWSECTDSCGGCGKQNRTLIFQNGTKIVHVRHCNTKPCANVKKPCCEPFKFRNEKCLIEENEMELNDLRNEIREAVLAWDAIKPGNEQFDEEERKQAIDEWNSIRGMQYVDDKKFIDTSYFDETDLSLNITNNTSSSNVTNEQSIDNGDFDNGEFEGKRNYGGKNYKRRQRRYRQHLPRTQLKSQDAKKLEEPQKIFSTPIKSQWRN